MLSQLTNHTLNTNNKQQKCCFNVFCLVLYVQVKKMRNSQWELREILLRAQLKL
jgi:hypothetical protein